MLQHLRNLCGVHGCIVEHGPQFCLHGPVVLYGLGSHPQHLAPGHRQCLRGCCALAGLGQGAVRLLLDNITSIECLLECLDKLRLPLHCRFEDLMRRLVLVLHLFARPALLVLVPGRHMGQKPCLHVLDVFLCCCLQLTMRCQAPLGISQPLPRSFQAVQHGGLRRIRSILASSCQRHDAIPRGAVALMQCRCPVGKEPGAVVQARSAQSRHGKVVHVSLGGVLRLLVPLDSSLVQLDPLPERFNRCWGPGEQLVGKRLQGKQGQLLPLCPPQFFKAQCHPGHLALRPPVFRFCWQQPSPWSGEPLKHHACNLPGLANHVGGGGPLP
mmetsp:Transcript_35943/g.90507  ORF Transcript_35943/g.90507 Transcript_35943/m.90507 type:complete len:327 (-) Transcript_35943:286-1266(-)